MKIRITPPERNPNHHGPDAKIGPMADSSFIAPLISASKRTGRDYSVITESMPTLPDIAPVAHNKEPS